jgi:hypothetical protein
MQVKGTIKVINPTQVISEKFSKREFVLTDESQYPQDILFQATQDKCSLLDNIGVGQQVEVSFNLRGREWTSPAGEVKYFNTLEAWRIEVFGAVNMNPNTTYTPTTPANEEDDDLPF